MCLSKVYIRNGKTEQMLLNNIQKIVVDGDGVVCTDLLEKDTRIEGKLISADLVNGKVIVETYNQE